MNSVNFIAWFNPTCSDTAFGPGIKSLFFFLSLFLLLSSLFFGSCLFSPNLLTQYSQSRQFYTLPQRQRLQNIGQELARGICVCTLY